LEHALDVHATNAIHWEETVSISNACLTCVLGGAELADASSVTPK
jgi:hypothetical protein